MHRFIGQFKRVFCFIVLQLLLMLCLESPHNVLDNIYPESFIIATSFTCAVSVAITFFAITITVVIIAAFTLAFVDVVTVLVTAIVDTVVVTDIIDVALLRMTAVVTHVRVCFILFI